MKSVSLSLIVDGAAHAIDVKIVSFDKEGPKIELFNSEGIVSGWDVPSAAAAAAAAQPAREQFAQVRRFAEEPMGAIGRPSGEHRGQFMEQPSCEHRGFFTEQPSGEHWNPANRPYREHGGRYQPPSDEPPRGVTVETRENLRFRGCEELRSEIQIKDNVIGIPAGMNTSYMSKVVVYNHSNRKISLDLSPLRSPFSCQYNNIVIEP